MILSKEADKKIVQAVSSIKDAAINISKAAHSFNRLCETVEGIVIEENKVGGAIERFRAAANNLADRGLFPK